MALWYNSIKQAGTSCSVHSQSVECGVISKRFRPLLYLALIIAAGLYLIPVYVLVVTGLKSFAQVDLDTMWALPSAFSLQSFAPAKGVLGLSRNFFNSVALVVPATAFSALLGSMNGYVLSKWRFRGSDTLFTLFLFGMFIPYQSILIPLVQTLQGLNLYGTLAGLILVHIVYGIPITTLIFRNYYAAVPTEMIEAGRIDGANLLDVYRYIMFPISLPGFVVVTIWQFTSIWNEFLFAVVITSKPSVQPITVALNNLAGSFVVEWNVQMAGALLAALPTLLVYIVLGRYFMRGLLAGSVTG